MKKTLIFAALVVAVVVLSQLYGERGTTFVMLLLVGALFIFAEMNSSIPGAATIDSASRKNLEFKNLRRPAA